MRVGSSVYSGSCGSEAAGASASDCSGCSNVSVVLVAAGLPHALSASSSIRAAPKMNIFCFIIVLLIFGSAPERQCRCAVFRFHRPLRSCRPSLPPAALRWRAPGRRRRGRAPSRRTGHICGSAWPASGTGREKIWAFLPLAAQDNGQEKRLHHRFLFDLLLLAISLNFVRLDSRYRLLSAA